MESYIVDITIKSIKIQSTAIKELNKNKIHRQKNSNFPAQTASG